MNLMKFQKIAIKQEVIQQLFNVMETFLNYFEYAIKIFQFSKKQQVHKQIKLVAHFYISD